MSSKRRIRRKSCKGKRRYLSITEAARAAWSMQRRATPGEHISAYHCQFCGGHHIGHTPHRQARQGA